MCFYRNSPHPYIRVLLSIDSIVMGLNLHLYVVWCIVLLLNVPTCRKLYQSVHDYHFRKMPPQLHTNVSCRTGIVGHSIVGWRAGAIHQMFEEKDRSLVLARGSESSIIFPQIYQVMRSRRSILYTISSVDNVFFFFCTIRIFLQPILPSIIFCWWRNVDLGVAMVTYLDRWVKRFRKGVDRTMKNTQSMCTLWKSPHQIESMESTKNEMPDLEIPLDHMVMDFVTSTRGTMNHLAWVYLKKNPSLICVIANRCGRCCS